MQSKEYHIALDDVAVDAVAAIRLKIGVSESIINFPFFFLIFFAESDVL